MLSGASDLGEEKIFDSFAGYCHAGIPKFTPDLLRNVFIGFPESDIITDFYGVSYAGEDMGGFSHFTAPYFAAYKAVYFSPGCHIDAAAFIFLILSLIHISYRISGGYFGQTSGNDELPL